MSRVERIGDAVLHLGDCRDLLPDRETALRGGGPGCDALLCDAVLTDPPFGVGYKSGHATDRLWAGGRSIANDHDTSVRDDVLRALEGVPMLVFGSRRAPAPAATKMYLTWDKGPALGMGDLSLPWKPTTEEIYVLGRGFVGARDKGAVIYHPPVQSMAANGRLHPNEKPVGLLRLLLQSLPTGLICDPFMGSGSTGVACALEARAFVGCEINPAYFDIACRRIEEAYKQPRLFAEPIAKPVQPDLIGSA
jgi:hypothetical protein